MKTIVLKFLLIGAALLFFGAFTCVYAFYKNIRIGSPTIPNYETLLRINESLRAEDAKYAMISTIGELLMICGVVSFVIAAFIIVKPSFKKP